MNRNRKSLLLLFLYVILFQINGQGQQLQFRTDTEKPGFIDLRAQDFNKQSAFLDGKWKFYWKALLPPGHKPEYFEYIHFPQLWNTTVWKKCPISTDGYATYEVTVLLPKTKEQLGLRIPDVQSAFHFYVNGKLLATNGTPGTSKETTIPYWSYQVKPITVSGDTLSVIIQVSNFHHVKGGPDKSIEIGLLSQLQATRDVEHAFDYFLTGCIFMGGCFFLGLYLFGRHDRAILYFSLFCLSYSYRIIGSRKYTLHSLFPDLSWSFTIHCEYISLFLAVAFFALYTKNLYPDDAPQKLMSVMAGICLGLAVITLISPPILFSRLIDPFMIVIMTYIAFAVYIYLKAVRNNRIGARYALVSTVAIFIIVISIIVEYYYIATPLDIILFLGYLVFFFCQSLILTFRFAFTLKQAKEEAELGLKVKSEFLSTMSHEIRTPLNSVIGMTHFIRQESPRPDQKEHLDSLLFSANNLLSIVNDVLDFSKIEEGKIHFSQGPVDISAIARNIMAGYKIGSTNRELKFILDIEEHLPDQITGDVTRLSQVIGNLVSNAVKFTPQGFVKLIIRPLSRTDQNITLEIAVEDSGIGIAEDKQQMIFERFTQVDSSSSRVFSGTGLGLAISKRILELQGIELQLNSVLGKGSKFFFVQTFPILKEKERETVLPAKEAPLPLSGVQILIVEDNPMNVLVLQNFLKRWGAISEVAHNGQEGLDLLDTSRHQIILMDLHMPVMDGYEATKNIRTRGEAIPIIALTASVALDVEHDVFAIGINEIVVKPFVPDNLLSVILSFVTPKQEEP
ncbi:response regulator [Dyadobacter sp. 32]|uniref:response regulator n=1 Tax=Dyadobacter sp. 32 TaxID=538966 RepID=UPI0011EFB9BC